MSMCFFSRGYQLGHVMDGIETEKPTHRRGRSENRKKRGEYQTATGHAEMGDGQRDRGGNSDRGRQRHQKTKKDRLNGKRRKIKMEIEIKMRMTISVHL